MTNSEQTCYFAFLRVIRNAGSISFVDLMQIGKNVFNLNAEDCVRILDSVIATPTVNYKNSIFSMKI